MLSPASITVAPPVPHPAAPSCLRSRLRHELAAPHARLDRALSRLDLGQAADLGLFLSVQRLGFAVLLRDIAATAPAPVAATAAVPPGGPLCGVDPLPLLRALGRALEDDLRALGLQEPPLPAPSAAPYDADAVAYVTLGSRLGTRVLAKQWARGPGLSGTAPTVLPAAYFGVEAERDAWQRFCAAAAALPADSAEATRITGDAGRIFTLFSQSFEMLSAGQSDPALRGHP